MNTTGNANYKSESTGQPDAFNQFYADNAAALKLIAKLEAERDEYKAKCEAYERAIVGIRTGTSLCKMCVHRENAQDKEPCNNCYTDATRGNNFTFDYARFANKGGDGERGDRMNKIKCGDIIRNNWVDNDSHKKYLVYLGKEEAMAKCIRLDPQKNVVYADLYYSDLTNPKKTNEGKDAFEIVGHVEIWKPGKDALLKLFEAGGMDWERFKSKEESA